VLRAQALHCERDGRVLFTDLHLEVVPGRVLQVQGSNGSGKSTLLRLLAGLNSEYSGELVWDGLPIRSQGESYRQALFFLGHSPAINRNLTPLQNLHWFCALRGFRDEAAVVRALAELGLAGYEDIPCYQMSAGQQRRVSLARLPLAGATLWILDEPFTALDRQGVIDLERRIAEFAARGGAVVLTTHHALQLDCPLDFLNLDVLAGRR
jgi:heme exporter protein A